MNNFRNYGREIANAALDIGAIKFNLQNPFQWASGNFECIQPLGA